MLEAKQVPSRTPGVIDVHNHFYPPRYLEELKKGDGAARVTADANGDYILSYEGDYNVLVPGHRDIEVRVRELDRAGISTQILSLTTPGVHIEERERGIALAQMTNDDFAAICARFPGRFFALAALPLQDPQAAVRELRRTVTELGFRGGTLFTNVNGETLDAPEFRCVFGEARMLDVPLFVHPTSPRPADAFLDYRLAALVGFATDTTLTFARLMFSGLLDDIPGLRLIASHLGGALPYLIERFDRGYRAYSECRRPSHEPSELLRQIYIDCVAFDPRAVRFAAEVMGSDQLLAGSDYPHQVGDIDACTAVIRHLAAPDDVKAGILHGNAERLFRL